MLIFQDCPKIQKMNLGLPLITDDGIKYLAEGCHELIELNIAAAALLTGNHLSSQSSSQTLYRQVS